jgi:hypothetical protein
MAGKKVTESFKVGDLVKIPHYGGQTARVVELWGPLGPGGVQVYRVRVRGRQKPVYIDLPRGPVGAPPARGLAAFDRRARHSSPSPLSPPSRSTCCCSSRRAAWPAGDPLTPAARGR